MLKRIPSILKNSKIKPQNLYSSEVIEKATKEVGQWFQKEFNFYGYKARIVASGMIERAKKQRIADTDPSAPDIFLTDEQKIEQLVSAAQKIVSHLKKSELAEIVDDLMEEDARCEEAE